MAIRRTRTRKVEEATSTERRPRADVAAKLEGRRARRTRATPETSQVVSSPNSDAILGEVMDRAAFEIRPQRGGDYLHVSDLIHRCTRKRALEHKYQLAAGTQRLTMSDLMTFAQGDAIHDALKERARVGAPHMVWGLWSCKCEYLKHEEPCTFEQTDQDETCPHCFTKVDRYHEVAMKDDEYMVSGSPDLILYLPRKDAFHVTELKSIAHDQWAELTRPKPDHVLQTIFYWHLMHRKGYRLTDTVSIFYVTKSWQFGAKKVYKEFLVDPQAELHRLEPLIEDAVAHKNYIAGGTLPPRTFCAHPNSKDAKACPAATVCFEV